MRELIGSLLFLSRCTRFDISFVIARLARFVTRWCEWARKEIRHILGFVAHTAEWSVIMKSADDNWEELRLGTFMQSQADGVKRQFLLDRVQVVCKDLRARVRQSQSRLNGDEQPKRRCVSRELWMHVV